MRLTAQILKQAETLDHHERWLFMIESGRKSLKDDDFAQALSGLADSDVHYERLLAFMSAHGSHEPDMIARFLQDRSSHYASCAIKLAARYLGDERLDMLIQSLPGERRAGLFRALVKAGRVQLNDRFFEKLNAQEQQMLLHWTSESCVRNHLDSNDPETLTDAQWGHLARRFPVLVLSILRQAIERQEALSWSLRTAVSTSLFKMYRFAPREGLALLRCAAARVDLRHLPLEYYARRYPEEIAALMLDHAALRPMVFSLSALKKLKEPMLGALYRKRAISNFKRIFPRLQLEQRLALYICDRESWRESSGALPVELVKALPPAIRQTEALHAMGVPLLASKPSARACYLAALPFSRARPLAEPFVSQPEGELRARTVAALVESGRYYPGELGSILDFCVKRENEQDPVRLAMMQALASLPPARWSPDHLPLLQTIIEGALKARDCSHQTMNAAALLLLNMVVHQTGFVVALLPALVECMGIFYVPSLESRMTDTQMIQLAPALMPLLKTWVARDRAHMALSLIFAFGRRARAVPDFTRLMIDLTNDKRGHTARSGLNGLFRLEMHSEITRLVPRLIAQDPGWIQEENVSRYLHRHRQSLLTPFFEAADLLRTFQFRTHRRSGRIRRRVSALDIRSTMYLRRKPAIHH